MRKIITYGINTETGHIYSRIGSEIALPILDFDNMLPENNFSTSYFLDKISVFELRREWDNIKWTKKIPLTIKNYHRKFWGLKELI